MKTNLSPKEHLPRLGSNLAIALVLALLASRAAAFSLLGPYTDWMVATNGYRQPGDIGGPMDINEEYRWNVPIVTYGFDKSFLDYFGTNGVAAVEDAIQTFNALPRASDIVLTDCPTESRRVNYPAQALGLVDLKSVTLSLLLEQLGLASPTRNIFDLRRVDSWFLQEISICPYVECLGSYYIIERNFDPVTLATSQYVNGTLYTGSVVGYVTSTDSGLVHYVEEIRADPWAPDWNAVGDGTYYYNPGVYRTGLTRDDVGGLRYLLTTC